MFAGTPYVSALFPFYVYAFSLCFYVRTFFTVGRAVSNIFVGRTASSISVGRAVAKISVSSQAWIPALLQNMTGNMRTTTYIARPILTYPKYRFQNPRTQFFMAYLHKNFLRASLRGGDGSQVIAEFFRHLRASRISFKRKTFYSSRFPYPALRSLCFILVQILLRDIVCTSH